MNKNPFLEGKIFPTLIKFSIPLMLSLILQALYGAVDLIVVGHFCNTVSVSAVATGGQVMHSITVIVTGLTMGVTVTLGHAIGAKDYKKAGGIIAGQIKLFTVVAIIITFILIAFAKQISLLMNVPDAAFEQTVGYIRICGSGMIFISAYNAISGIFRGIGNSRSPFIFVLIACVINIILDLLFVGVMNFGYAGAAYATVIAQALSVVFSLIYIKKEKLPFAVTRESFELRGAIKEILKIGTPIALQDFLLQISFLIITSIVNTLGVVASASVGIVEKMFIFLAIVPLSFLSALSAFVAQNTGANRQDRSIKALKVAMSISLTLGTTMFLLAFFAGEQLTSIFANEQEVIVAAASYLKGSSFEYIFIAISFCLLGYFNGLGRTNFVMIQSFISAFLVRIPMSYYLSKLPNTNLFIISTAVSVSALTSLVLCIFYYIKLERERNSNDFL